MAGNLSVQMSDVDDERLSDFSTATTCFGGQHENPHINELRTMRKATSVQRRHMMYEYNRMLNASPEVREDDEPECDLHRALFGDMVIKYVEAARKKAMNEFVNEYTLNMVAQSVELMRDAWSKTKYFGGHQPNFVLPTRHEITAPVKMPTSNILGSHATSESATRQRPEMTPTTEVRAIEDDADDHLGVTSAIGAISAAPSGSRPPILTHGPSATMTPVPDVRAEKDANIERRATGGAAGAMDANAGVTGATGAINAASPKRRVPLFTLDPSATATPVSDVHVQALREMGKEREEMKRQMTAHFAQVLDENRKATQQQIAQMQQDFLRQMQESRENAQQAESQVKHYQDQARKERAEKEKEMAMAAAMKTEMQKVREKERNSDRRLREMEEQKKAREKQEQAEHSALLQQQQRAEQQINDLKHELERQKENVNRNIASPSARGVTVNKTTTSITPLRHGYMSNEGFFAMKQLAVSKAKDARPEVPFASGTSIEYALHMNAFDSATDSDALDAKDKLFELTKWFAGPASKIVNAYNVRKDKAEAYAAVRSELDVFFSQHRDSFNETLKEVKKGGQIDKDDYDAHFELYSNLKEAQMMLVASHQVQEFDRRDVLRDILESRLDHMSDKFWLKDEEKMRTMGSPMKFDDLLIHIQRWMTVLNNKGKAHKRPTSKTTAISPQTSSAPAKPTYANRLVNSQPKQQSTERCNICGSIHATEDCHQLVSSDVESRKNLLLSRGLCFHCFESDHLAKECAKKKFICCAICKRHHATLLHDHRYASPPRTTADRHPFRPSVSPEAYAATNVAASASTNGAIVNPTI